MTCFDPGAAAPGGQAIVTHARMSLMAPTSEQAPCAPVVWARPAATADEKEAACRRVIDRAGGTSLFGNTAAGELPWRVSPEPFPLAPQLLTFVNDLGHHLVAFYKATNQLYFKSVKGLMPRWIHEYLDQGKPESVVDFSRRNRSKQHLPPVIRPDLLLTENGPIASELDSVPGGMGFTDFLARAYSDLGYPVLGGADGMAAGFARMVRAHMGDQPGALAIVVSEESASYRPEMNWLSEYLRADGLDATVLTPQEIHFASEDGLSFRTAEGEVRQIRFLYRFFELFDLKNIPKWELIAYAAKKEKVVLLPPAKPFLEEKMLFALMHHPALGAYWRNALGEETFRILKGTFPRTWVLDPRQLQAYGVIPGLTVNGDAIQAFSQLGNVPKSGRPFVVKPSGFSPLAWGSKGVSFADDLSLEDWQQTLQQALDSFEQTPYILQEFHKSCRYDVEYLDTAQGRVRTMSSRVRLCPYYFLIDDAPELAGVLATLVPSDKKAIHGMADGIMGVCQVGQGTAGPGSAARREHFG
jgi:hypothetical protein